MLRCFPIQCFGKGYQKRVNEGYHRTGRIPARAARGGRRRRENLVRLSTGVRAPWFGCDLYLATMARPALEGGTGWGYPSSDQGLQLSALTGVGQANGSGLFAALPVQA